jgi:hypothetical protein
MVTFGHLMALNVPVIPKRRQLTVLADRALRNLTLPRPGA